MDVPEKIILQVGRRIAELRRRRSLTQEQLAELLTATGLTATEKNEVSDVERGLGNPQLKTLVSYANALGVPTSSLFARPRPESLPVRLGRPRKSR